MALAGGKKPVDLNSNSLQMDELAKFAVSEHNSSNESTVASKKLDFKKVISAHTQVVQGTMYHLLIEVEEEAKPKHYEAQVWVRPWENFKKLNEFKAKEVAT